MEIKNRKAKFKFEILETYTAGIMLKGTEIKSIRNGKVSFVDSFCYIDSGGVFMKNVHIDKYEMGNINNHDPYRVRKLLLTKKEIQKLDEKVKEKRLTIVPLKIFINNKNLAKVEIALAKGKNVSDKRKSIKERDIDRDSKRDLNF